MTINKIVSAMVYLKELGSPSDQRARKISFLIKQNVCSANIVSRINLDYWLSYSRERSDNQRVGHLMAELVTTQDWETARTLLNDNERIRNHWSRSGKHDEVAEWFNETFPEADEVFTCDDCNYLELADEGHWAHDGNEHICDVCTSENYTWSDIQDTYITNDEYDEEQEQAEQDNSVIGDYHSSKRILSRIPSSFDDRKPRVFLGLELEMEVKSGDREDIAQGLYDAISFTPETQRYMALENDGSLYNGFEMVTGWTGLDVHAKQLQHFKKPIRGLKSHDTSTCGLHVHICKAGMTLFHAVKMVLFINDSGNQRLVRALARRDSCRYSNIKNKKAGYEWLHNARTENNLRYLNSDRYEALNFQNERTIEFRMFKGTLRYETIMACLEFTYATWFFCRDTGTNQLTADNFLKFISRAENLTDTKFLRQYLTEKNWELPELGKIKNNPRIEKTTTSTIEE